LKQVSSAALIFDASDHVRFIEANQVYRGEKHDRLYISGNESGAPSAGQGLPAHT
jgi:hypothetical protein